MSAGENKTNSSDDDVIPKNRCYGLMVANSENDMLDGH